jgi:hypothetical protein
MRLGHVSFPIKVSIEDITTQIKGFLEEKGWEEFEIPKPELVFFPYWVFNYNSFSESADETGVKTTAEGEQGITAMNGQNSELEEEIGSVYDQLESELVHKPIETEFKVIRFRIREAEANRLAQLKIAAKLGIDKENVVISGLKQVYFPVWIGSASFEEQTIEFQIDAVQGNLLSEEEVPERGRTAGELAGETFSDLRNPFNWVLYLFNIIKGIVLFFWNNPFSKWFREELRTNPRFQIAILLLIVFLIFANEWGWIHFPKLPELAFLKKP